MPVGVVNAVHSQEAQNREQRGIAGRANVSDLAYEVFCQVRDHTNIVHQKNFSVFEMTKQ